MKRLLVGLAAVIALGSVGALAQLWQNFPIVGGAAYCASYTNARCSTTIPAGPTVITGNETIPGDTNLAAGAGPQTVKFSMQSLNLLPTDFETVTAGSAFYTYTFANNVGRVVFVAAGTISDERVTAPPAPVNGQTVEVASSHTITAFQFIANTGQTLAVTTPTVLTASTTVPQGYKWVYNSANAVWYRVH